MKRLTAILGASAFMAAGFAAPAMAQENDVAPDLQ